MTSDCRHRWFFGLGDPDLGIYRSNVKAIQMRLPGKDFFVRCAHCGETLCGTVGDGGDPVEVVWEHRGDTFFGEFYCGEFKL